MCEMLFILAGYLSVLFTSQTPVDFSEKDLMHLASHLPQIHEEYTHIDNPDICISHVESSTFYLSQNSSNITIYDSWNSKLPPDFIHLLYGACRIEWIKRGIFPVHSACVGTDQSGYVLLVGQSGSGKTSTTLTCAKEHNLQIFSGDKTLVHIDPNEHLVAIGGTKPLTVRMEDKDRWIEMIEKAYDT